MGAQALACNPVYHAKTKHIELDVHFVRNLISDQKLEDMFQQNYNLQIYLPKHFSSKIHDVMQQA